MNLLIEITQTVFFTSARLFAQVEYSYSASSKGQAPGPLFWIFYLAFTILMIAAWWKIFTKAGQPGWACIIPIYNLYVWCKTVGRPWWWILLMLIPFVNFIILIILIIDLAKSFGKGVGFGIGLLLLPIIFFPILGFGSAQYQGPTAGSLGSGAAISRPPQPV
jgi:uncharacterized membrane protein YhaH (DUF805 family)